MLTLPARAIVIRHDRADSSYVVEAKHYPQLFYLHTRNERKVCLATLISPRWAITAGHCIDDTPIGESLAGDEVYNVAINESAYYITSLVLHPEYQNGHLLQGVDLALIQIDRSIEGVVPVSLNRHDNELDKVMTLLGWGYTGTGTTGRRSNDGKLRRAENQVDAAESWLEFNFDDPRVSDSKALSLEGVPGLGDSGGPALMELEQGLFLMGVAVGEIDRKDVEPRQGVYGATEVYERISLHLEWIESVIGLR